MRSDYLLFFQKCLTLALKQFAYYNKKSTIDEILSIIENFIDCLQKKNFSGMFSCFDESKAFDTVKKNF